MNNPQLFYLKGKQSTKYDNYHLLQNKGMADVPNMGMLNPN
jgi:hypothetical protein